MPATLAPLLILGGVISIAMALLFKPWIRPKKGEIWQYQASDPFEKPIDYRILDVRKGYVLLEVVKDYGKSPYEPGYVTTRSLLWLRNYITKIQGE